MYRQSQNFWNTFAKNENHENFVKIIKTFNWDGEKSEHGIHLYLEKEFKRQNTTSITDKDEQEEVAYIEVH